MAVGRKVQVFLKKIKRRVKRYLNRNLKYTPDMGKLEILLTTRCNLYCFNCDISCRQAPSDSYMSIGQIQKFIHESLDTNWLWTRIRLLGGEPLLHPQFLEIIKLFEGYKKIKPSCRIEVTTNGFGVEVNEMLTRLPSWCDVGNTRKKTVIHDFSSFNIAPVDLKEYKNDDFSGACIVTQYCGIGLSMHGFYPCAVGAGIDRVCGFDIGIKELPSINGSRLKTQLETLCGYCGHYKTRYSAETINEEKMSPAWLGAYAKYKINAPTLSLY
jgi:hypothetical protein